MKKLFLSLMLLASPLTAFAAYIPISNTFYLTAPDTPATFIALYCEENMLVEEGSTQKIFQQKDCFGTPHHVLVSSPTIADLAAVSIAPDVLAMLGDPTGMAGASTTMAAAMSLQSAAFKSVSFFAPAFIGSASQYTKGDGTYGTLPGAGSRTFNYPTRTINTCYQISATQDSLFNYKIDIITGLSLTTGAQGTVAATSYTNSGCTTGAQAIADGTASQTGTLIVGLGINQTISVGLSGALPAGKWIKLTTANTVGTPSFSLRAVQAETLL